MATAEEIVRGLSQVLADSYDGATDEKGDPLEMGLRRGAFDANITDKRVNDGFGLSVNGNVLIVKYQGEVTLKEIKDKNFESDMGQCMADVLKFIKKQYKKVTGNTLSCKPIGDMSYSVQSTSRVRTWVEAQARYKIAGMDGVANGYDAPSGEELLDKSIRKFLGMGKKDWSAKKPENVTRKKEQ
jgi:hypothetical protein